MTLAVIIIVLVADGLENGAYGENVDHHVQATVQAEIRAEAMTPSKLRPGSQGIASPTLQVLIQGKTKNNLYS